MSEIALLEQMLTLRLTDAQRETVTRSLRRAKIALFVRSLRP